VGCTSGELKAVHEWLKAIGVATTRHIDFLVTAFSKIVKVLQKIAGSRTVPDIHPW
jgi:hypothetical protein